MSEQASGAFKQTVAVIDNTQVITAADELFNHVDDGKPMWADAGDRSLRVVFKFRKKFQTPPAVTLGVIGIDCDHRRNLRYSLATENVTARGFEVVFVTWDDTRIARASISWQATGQTQTTRRPNRPVKKDPATG